MVSPYRLWAVLKECLIHLFLLCVAATCVFPLFWMVRCSLMTNKTIFTDKGFIPSEIHFENYIQAASEGNFGMYFFNSILYTVCVVVGIVLIASLAAYAFSRLTFPGKNAFYYMFLAGMLIPLPGGFVPLVVLMNKLGLANSRLGYILCMINVGLSISIILLKPYFDKIPKDLEDAARMDGCSRLGVWWHVAVPFARPGIAVVVMINSLNVWNEYILALLLLGEKSKMPLQRGIMVFYGSHSVDYAVLMAGLTITAVPILIFYFILQKHIIRGLQSSVIVG